MENKKAPKEKKQKSKKAKIIGNSIFFTFIGLLVTLFVWNFIDIRSGYKCPIFGLRTSVIVSNSMATVNDANTYITPKMKQIQKYDVVTTINYKSFDEIKQYDVATYYTGSKNLMCHRVVDKYIQDGKKYVVFRGDANAINDEPVSYSLVKGKVISVTPKMGHVVAFLQSPYFFLAIFGTVFFVALGLFIADLGKEKKAQARQENVEPIEENQEIVIEEQTVIEQNQPVEESITLESNEEVISARL